MSNTSCWVIYDEGKVGTGNQCLGLADALGFDPVVVEVRARFPWKYLPSFLWWNALKCVTTQSGSFLKGPWPDLVIGAGRASAAPVAAIGRITQGRTKTIQILNPRMSSSHFDLVVAPAHDLYKGSNVIETIGALHRVTQDRLKAQADIFRDSVLHLPRPLVAVLVGGGGRRFRLDKSVIEDLKNRLQYWVETYNVGLAILPSRRTGPENCQALREAFVHMPAVVWDFESANPYLGYLGLADYIVVTSDSVSMATEACYTGKPVYIYHLPGGPAIFDRFHKALENGGYTKPLSLSLSLDSWAYPPLDELSSVATEIKRHLQI